MRIPLTRGYFAIVDAADFEWLSQWKWHVALRQTSGPYAIRSQWTGKDYRKILMHKEILGSSQKVDHKNANGLDNRRRNLRHATRTQNNANRKKQVGCSSKYKGVFWDVFNQKWRVQITYHRKSFSPGRFSSEAAAARAYNKAAKRLFGEFAQHHISTGRQWVKLRRKLGLTTPKMWRRGRRKGLLAKTS